MLKKILVPLDGSELGELALEYAGELGTAFDSEVQLACATERQDDETKYMCSVYLEKIIERLSVKVKKQNPAALVKAVVIDGKPANALLTYAKKEKIGLIIMVSHGRSGIMPWVMGSTASKIIQRSPKPVLLVRASASRNKRRPLRLFNKILVPLDGSRAGEAALPYIKAIAQQMKSEVFLLRVIEVIQHIRTIGGLDHFTYTEDQIERMKNEGVKYLEKIQRQFSVDKVHTVLRTGDPAQEIIKLSQEKKVNLVAMSSHGKSGIRRWVVGSVSSKVLQADKMPLLLVRPKKIAG